MYTLGIIKTNTHTLIKCTYPEYETDHLYTIHKKIYNILGSIHSLKPYLLQVDSYKNNSIFYKCPINTNNITIESIKKEDYFEICTHIYIIVKLISKYYFITDVYDFFRILKINNKIVSIFLINIISFKSVKSYEFNYPFYYPDNIYTIFNKGFNKFLCNSVKKIACVLHIGDIEIFNKMKKYIDNIALGNTIYYKVKFYITIYKKEYLSCIEKYFVDFPHQDYMTLVVENRGMDIGGFFKVLQHLHETNNEFDYIIKLHTKTCDSWRESLCLIVNSIKTIRRVLNIFKILPKVGIISDKKWSIKMDKLNENKVKLFCDKNKWSFTEKDKFVGGTMFWIRFTCIKTLLELDLEEIYQTFEEGYIVNDKETNTHSWERLLCLSINKTKHIPFEFI